jgi:hypothetical protein
MNRLIAGEIVDIRTVSVSYEYREYPKWVTLADGSQLIVHDADEEYAAIGEEADVQVASENLLEALREEAKALGLNPHHRAGVEKLREMIEGAKNA